MTQKLHITKSNIMNILRRIDNFIYELGDRIL